MKGNVYFYIGCDLEYCRMLYDSYIRYYNCFMFVVTSNINLYKYFKDHKKIRIIIDKAFQLTFLKDILEGFDQTEKIELFEVDEIVIEMNIGKLLRMLEPYITNNSRIVYKYDGYDENFIFFTKNEFAEFYQNKIEKMEVNSNSKLIELKFNYL